MRFFLIGLITMFSATASADIVYYNGLTITATLDGAAVLECRGVPGCVWGGPDVADGLGAKLSAQLAAQFKSYGDAKEQALETQKPLDWELVRSLALRTWIQSTIDQRIAIIYKKAGIEYVEGTFAIKKIDREKLELARTWYRKAWATAKKAEGVSSESENHNDQSAREAKAIKKNARGNIAWIHNLIEDKKTFDADGNNVNVK